MYLYFDNQANKFICKTNYKHGHSIIEVFDRGGSFSKIDFQTLLAEAIRRKLII